MQLFHVIFVLLLAAFFTAATFSFVTCGYCFHRNLMKIFMSGPELLLSMPVMAWQQISDCHVTPCAAELLCNIVPFFLSALSLMMSFN